MADYTYHELMKMQSDAIRRAEDMQRRARKSAGFYDKDTTVEKPSSSQQGQSQEIRRDAPKRVHMPDDYLRELKEYANSASNKKDVASELTENVELQNESKSKGASAGNNIKTPTVKKSTDGVNGILGDVKIDEDKALLLSLVLLLSEEKADETLILALLYMLS